jgi:hypothetical protein
MALSLVHVRRLSSLGPCRELRRRCCGRSTRVSSEGWRALATIHAMIDVFDGIAADSIQTSQIQSLATTWAQVLRAEFPTYTSGAKDRAVERSIALTPAAQPHVDPIVVLTGERPWIPTCDAHHGVDVDREYDLVTGNLVSLQCVRSRHRRTARAVWLWLDRQASRCLDRCKYPRRVARHEPCHRSRARRRGQSDGFCIPAECHAVERRCGSTARSEVRDGCDTRRRTCILLARTRSGHRTGVVYSPVRPQYRYLLRTAPRRIR